ncbi:MAG: prepilin-type N-terminal cleavage/methylation domain-containing protein, partial [Phycisphaerales bacterium]
MSPNQKSQIRNRKSTRGFTLTEILLVVAIIAMVGGLGSGYCVGTYKKLLVEKAARQFLLMARYARIMAIEQQKPYELEIDPNNQGFLLATVQADPRTGESQKVLVRDYFCKPVKFEGDVKFEDVQLLAYGEGSSSEVDLESRIQFFPSGAAESAIVQIGDGKTHYSVAVVAATGKASLYVGLTTDVKTASID